MKIITLYPNLGELLQDLLKELLEDKEMSPKHCMNTNICNIELVYAYEHCIDY